jgi:hypothetical protein
MSLDQIIELIIDDRRTASPYMRAIQLFEFQVAITDSRSFEKFIAAETLVRDQHL